ncbi:MAG: transglycosylase SLT domain-containing protein [Myxococcales bacterium]|nr:transglycosylase SLT domain-containing protein [Myxococcales bacterium]
MSFLRSTRGNAMSPYLLAIATVAVGGVAAFTAFGDSMSMAITDDVQGASSPSDSRSDAANGHGPSATDPHATGPASSAQAGEGPSPSDGANAVHPSNTGGADALDRWDRYLAATRPSLGTPVVGDSGGSSPFSPTSTARTTGSTSTTPSNGGTGGTRTLETLVTALRFLGDSGTPDGDPRRDQWTRRTLGCELLGGCSGSGSPSLITELLLALRGSDSPAAESIDGGFSDAENEMWMSLLGLAADGRLSTEDLLAFLQGEGDLDLPTLLEGLWDAESNDGDASLADALADPDLQDALARRFLLWLSLGDGEGAPDLSIADAAESLPSPLLAGFALWKTMGPLLAALGDSADGMRLEALLAHVATTRGEGLTAALDRLAARDASVAAAEQQASTPAPTAIPVKDHYSAAESQQIVREVAAGRGWDSGPEWDALNTLVTHESGWDHNAQNPESSAYGLFQFINSTWGLVDATKTHDPRLQAEAGLEYIARVYGTPSAAWAQWTPATGY